MRAASFSTLICCFVRLLLLSDCSRLADTPLDADTVNMVRNEVKNEVLTADGCRLPEDLRHLRIHLDHDIFFDSNLFMTDFDLSFDPLRELLLKNGGAHVGQPLLRCLRELNRRLGQVRVHLRMVLVEEAPDLLYTKAFVPARKTVSKIDSLLENKSGIGSEQKWHRFRTKVAPVP